MLADALTPWMKMRGWRLEDHAIGRLETLLTLWVRYGAVMNLSGARSPEALLPQVLDGLDTAWIVREKVGDGPELRWVDFGSGGGFPALVVAAVGRWTMMLMEPRQKRAGFLELALGSIGRGSIVVERARFERSTWGENVANGFIRSVEPARRIASARAVWAPEDWKAHGLHVVETGGHVVLHLAHDESAEKLGAESIVRSERGRVCIVEAGDSDELR